MNIDVNLLNQINDKMYEIYKKYGEQTVINLLNYRLKNIKKGDKRIIKYEYKDDDFCRTIIFECFSRSSKISLLPGLRKLCIG